MCRSRSRLGKAAPAPPRQRAASLCSNSIAVMSRSDMTSESPRAHHVLINDRMIHKCIDRLAVVPSNRAWRVRQEHDHELLLRICPPIGAAGAWPGKISDRTHQPHDTWCGSNGQAETKTIIRARRIGVADQVLHFWTELVRQHIFRGL